MATQLARRIQRLEQQVRDVQFDPTEILNLGRTAAGRAELAARPRRTEAELLASTNPLARKLLAARRRVTPRGDSVLAYERPTP
jgi:DNA-binding IclR family transcriptional regulator